MIYTVTFNPSLDYVVGLDKFIPGTVNRAASEHIYPGGKGINVSVMLSHLGYESRILGFSAGFTGRSLQDMLKYHGCPPDFIEVKEGQTRINVKLNAGEETEINGQGPTITGQDMEKLYQKLDILQRGDWLVLAGSIPGSVPRDVYERIIERLYKKGVHCIVDAEKELLMDVLKYKPFLIKPNHHELEEMFGKELKIQEEIIRHARLLQEMGAVNVLVSMDAEGAVLATGSGEIYQRNAPKGRVVNSVGAGDSMVAGFLAGYLQTGDYEKALELGVAAGSATAFTSWLAKKEEIYALPAKEMTPA